MKVGGGEGFGSDRSVERRGERRWVREVGVFLFFRRSLDFSLKSNGK